MKSVEAVFEGKYHETTSGLERSVECGRVSGDMLKGSDREI